MLKPSLQTILSVSQNFEQPFEMTDDVMGFISEYELMAEIEPTQGNYAELQPQVAAELKRTSDLFYSYEHAEKNFKENEAGLRSYLDEEIKRLGKGIVTYDVTLNEPGRYMGEAYAYAVTFKDPNGKETDISVLYYAYEPGLGLAEGASSWSWAAWLGVESSPFYDSDFSEAYDYDQAANSMGELLSMLDQSQDKFDIEQAIESVVKNYEPEYEYRILLDERGMFQAGVFDASGSNIYSINNEDPETGELGEIPEVQDGFMRHATDIRGLETYLKQLGIIPENATIVKEA